MLCDLQASLQNLTPLEITYSSAHKQINEEMLFEPYSIFFHLRGWYTVGRDSKRNEVRMLKLSRINRTAKMISRNYIIPNEWTLEGFLGNAWGIVPDEKTYSVRIRFSPAGAEYVKDTMWHKTQKIEKQKDGSIIYTAEVDGLKEIIWWILGFGDTAIVEEPEELRLAVLSYTLGYDLYHPSKNVIWHEYGRQENPKIWKDTSKNNEK